MSALLDLLALRRGTRRLGMAVVAALLVLGVAGTARAQGPSLALIDDPGMAEVSLYVYDVSFETVSALEGNLEQIEEDLFDVFALAAALPLEIRTSTGTRGLALESVAIATTMVQFSVAEPTWVRLSWDFAQAGNGDPAYGGGQFFLESVGTGAVLFNAEGGPKVGSFAMLLQPNDIYFVAQGMFAETIALGELRSGYASLAVIPEPTAAQLLALGLLLVLAQRKRQAKHS